MLFVHLNSDYNTIQNGESINHFKSASIRILVYTIYFAIVTQSFTETVLYEVFYLLLYWLYFDLMLNLKRGSSPNYVGGCNCLNCACKAMTTGKASLLDTILRFFKIKNVIKFKVYIIAIYTLAFLYLFEYSNVIDQYLLKLIQSIL